MYVPKCEGVWRTRSNLELQNACKPQDVVTGIKARTLEWLRHIIRIEDTRIPKRKIITLTRMANVKFEDQS
jgi:hypothetical protein